jgi:hypothetical protein
MVIAMAYTAPLRESRDTRAKKREDVEAKKGAVEEAEWIEVVREREKENNKERTEAMVRVEVARNCGGGGERSEAEMARKGRDVESLIGKGTEMRRRSLGVGLGLLRRRRWEEGVEERRFAMAARERVRGWELELELLEDTIR